MNRLRTRLIAVFVLATLVPLGLTLWTTLQLVDTSLELAPLNELKEVTGSLESTGRVLYQVARESLRREAAQSKGTPVSADHLAPGVEEEFVQSGVDGSQLDYFVRRGDQVVRYSRPIGVPLQKLTGQIAKARHALEVPEARDVRAGFSRTLIVVAAGLWLIALTALIYLAARIDRPIRQLTQGLGRVASGDLTARVESSGEGEIGEAMVAFNNMTAQMQQAREHLIQVTRVASWQALARKMAHEVKNSLTPIRLTVEEIASRKGASDPFMEQASQIVTDEITTLEKRVRAFSDFAAEPPVTPVNIDVNALVEERIAFLKTAHPEVAYRTRPAPGQLQATADADLVKGVLTNILENAAHAAGPNGSVLARTTADGDRITIEIHDSGPGLSAQAKSSLFEPTISFKKGGMGLGLSIARRSAVLCGGDLQTFEGELGGAGFRLVLPRVTHGE